MNGPFEAIVLAGGEGSRLRPLTKYRPKPMLPVANRPIIEYVLDALVAVGVDRVVVVIGHRGDRIRDHLTDSYRDIELAFVTQKNQLGSGHALQQAAGLVDDPFIVVNGDNVLDADLVRATVARFTTGDGAAAAAVAESATPQEYGAVLTDNGHIRAVIENPSDAVSYRINAGVYVCTDDIFDALDRADTRAGELYITDALVDLPGDVLVAETDGTWLDPSYPWDLLSVTESLLLARPDLVGEAGSFDDGVFVADSANVHETATVEAPAVVGPDCEVDAGAVVRRATCLGPNTHVGPNTVVERSILGPDTTVGGTALLRDTLVGAGATIGDGTVAAGGPADVVISDRLHRNRRLGGVVGDRATIGANVTLESGVRVAPTTSVPAGSTATGRLEDGAEVMH
ncbi:sugar phosphate nucleotidyltransferase [Halobacteriaceae archaeon GCM10025711]